MKKPIDRSVVPAESASAPNTSRLAPSDQSHSTDGTAPEQSDFSEGDPDYRVGYGRPPRSTQFKKGKSGNPRGRPKGLPNFRTVVETELRQKIPLRQGDKISSATKQRAFVLTLLDGALKRDPKAMTAFIALLRSLAMLGEPVEPIITDPVTANDREIIADFIRRNETAAEVAASLENSVKSQESTSRNMQKK